MKKVFTLFLIFLFCFSALSNAQNEVKIGEQVWMSENLNVTTFRNGDPIPQAQSDQEWKNAAKDGKPAWCFYKNETANGSKYGKLYNWYAVNDSRLICPAGWHVATDEDWKSLETYLGGNAIAAIALRSTEWVAIGNSTNSSGFAALPAGIRFNIKLFLYLSKNGYWWTSTSVSKSKAFCRQISYTDTFVMTKIFDKKHGLSVRCVRD